MTDFAPHLIHQPHSVVVQANKPHTSECPVEAQPESSVKWFKDNRLLASKPMHVEQTGSELMFFQINDNDTGDYHCEASNYLGSVTSEQFRLTVQTSKYSPANCSLTPGRAGQLNARPTPPTTSSLLTQYLTIHLELTCCLVQLALLCVAYQHDRSHLNLSLETFLF